MGEQLGGGGGNGSPHWDEIELTFLGMRSIAPSTYNDTKFEMEGVDNNNDMKHYPPSLVREKYVIT
jgi:hypothetical protein